VRYIPVFQAGTVETKGNFYNLDKDTTINLTFDKNLGKVTVYAEANIVNVILDELKHLRIYGYWCNEQLSSKLKGMLWERIIYKQLNKPYPYEKDIRKMIKLLEERRNTDSLWGWWQNCETQWWITAQVAEALLQAKKDGFEVPIQLNELPPRVYMMYSKLSYRDKMRAVNLLKEINPVSDYKKLIDSIQIYPKDTVGRYELMELKQLVGLPCNIDSLLIERKTTMFGNSYWGTDGCSLFDDAVSATLVAYRILKKDSIHAAMLPRIRSYFLEKRGNSNWRNTWESCRILETVLPDLIRNEQVGKIPTLSFEGTIHQKTNTYPCKYETSAEHPLSIHKEGNAPVYLTTYQQFYNNNPSGVDKDFTVKTMFENNDSILIAGKPIRLITQVTVKKASEYVLVEIPIPAGCSYQEKTDYNRNEAYREYYKEKVSIFCTRLAQGVYTYEVSLLPRYNGIYKLNPAKAELMYFPVFYGRERMKTVKIK
jgi:uncharacterized protein YfaS (alpha-2-macroglobulin family)